MSEAEKDKLHSARVALMAADATLAMVLGHSLRQPDDYRTDRIRQTLAIVRRSLLELDG